MRILHTVESYYPSVGGMQEVVKQLSERLVRLGHSVTVATTALAERTEHSINGVAIAEFKLDGNTVRGITGDRERYERFLLESPFDIITNFAAQQWATDIALPLLKKISAKKVFVPTGFSRLYDPAYKEYFISMRAWMKEYDMNIFLSDDYRDINFAREHDINKTLLIPNGAGEGEFLRADTIDIRKQLGISADHFLILHVGSHTQMKGHREASEIFRRAGIRNATLLIIGNISSGDCARMCRRDARFFRYSPIRLLDGKKLIVRSLSREETVAAYKSADLFLFPSNIECSPLALFEAAASRTPFLTTDVGNSAEIISWTGGGELLPTTKDSEDNSHADIKGSILMLEEIYRSKEKRETMSEKGFEAWKTNFTWEHIASRYEQLYLRLLQK